MIRIFRKSWRRSRRTVCAALCLLLLSSLLAVPAGAADLTGRLYINNSVTGGIKEVSSSFPVSSNHDGIVVGTNTANGFRVKPFQFRFEGLDFKSGSIGFYVSFYYVANGSVSVVNPSVSAWSDYYTYITNVDGASTQFGSDTVQVLTFSPSPIDGSTVSSGRVLKAHINSYDGMIGTRVLGCRVNSYDGVSYFDFGAGSGSVQMVIPSISVISGTPSDLGSLENIADSIAAQSQVMSQFYGDIMELLNDLYTRLGDMQAVEELTNTYFAQLIPLVNSINTNTVNIYSLLQTQFQLLRTLISTESDDIQSAIEKQTQDLKAYFDTVFSGATGDMPEMSDDLQSSVGDFSDAESGYQSNATERFEELASTFSGFTGGTLAGVTLASTLFTRVWNALGQYNIVYYFPLLLGLSLVIIGRLPRGSGGQSSSEKHRGDSSA